MGGFHDNMQAQEHQLQTDQHKVVENDPDITDYPVNSYVLYTPPMGRSNKLCSQSATLCIQPYSGQSSQCSSAERARIRSRRDLVTSWQPS